VHTNRCNDNIFETRVEGTTQPWLGSNLYGANRDPPRVPWKPEEVKGTEKALVITSSKEDDKQKVEEEKKEEENYNVSNEFNALANLIIQSAQDTEKDNFKLNLFPN